MELLKKIDNIANLWEKTKDPKYKGNTSGLERALRKYAGRRFDDNAFIQKVLKKHAEMNEQMMFDEVKNSRVV